MVNDFGMRCFATLFFSEELIVKSEEFWVALLCNAIFLVRDEILDKQRRRRPQYPNIPITNNVAEGDTTCDLRLEGRRPVLATDDITPLYISLSDSTGI